MAAPSLIIFDCDGVLVDSEIIAAEVESALLTEAGYQISADEMAERFAGLTWQDILLTVEREAGIPLSASLLDKSEKFWTRSLRTKFRRLRISWKWSRHLNCRSASAPIRPAIGWKAC